MRAILRVAAGIGLILIGIVGLILPIMPGWVFIIPGLVLISDHFPPAKRLLEWGKAKVEKHDPGFFNKKGRPAEPAAESQDTTPSSGTAA